MIGRKKLYSALVKLLSRGAAARESLLSSATEQIMGGCPSGVCPIGPMTEMRGALGAVLLEMEENGVVSVENGIVSLVPSVPVALRAESCEKEIIALLSEKPLPKRELRDALVEKFGTGKTATLRDDNILYTLIGQVTKRLINRGIITLTDGEYRISAEKAAKIGNINELATLKSDLLSGIHAKGGEFFEHYILTLLAKHFEKHGKAVLECSVTGGSADGGIDGIIKTVDPLGFRETVMVQAKNRLEMTNETAVRSFYGAVCAAQGGRGIFATTSDFHPSALTFLSGIDNCVGVNADTIFKLACECLYGIKKRGDKYVIDTKII